MLVLEGMLKRLKASVLVDLVIYYKYCDQINQRSLLKQTQWTVKYSSLLVIFISFNLKIVGHKQH